MVRLRGTSGGGHRRHTCIHLTSTGPVFFSRYLNVRPLLSRKRTGFRQPVHCSSHTRCPLSCRAWFFLFTGLTFFNCVISLYFASEMIRLGGSDWLLIASCGELLLGIAISGMVFACSVSSVAILCARWIRMASNKLFSMLSISISVSLADHPMFPGIKMYRCLARTPKTSLLSVGNLEDLDKCCCRTKGCIG